MSSTKDLSRRDVLRQELARLAERDQELQRDAERADQLNDHGSGVALLASLMNVPEELQLPLLQKAGFESMQQLRRAVHASAPTKDAPLYMVAALKRQEVRVRAGTATAGVGGAVVVIMQPPPEPEDDDEDVIDITPKEPK